ncbi:uncharacterized protein LOC130628988 [Hydractinia symbiolongicarpus]|uniref:uncharacterized protein LOC130628988 n=1 Tax=Hydractinia symbiolongicarpus TaxID=13093 RepID=UPI0025503483|nr:uncharacterized protein LOC130628988 [Hydractinia symbiolongicarpus]XP_057298050.1 uncharacterized protein LOC130628988 [Hydractinia symbiolongicarpus]
MAEFIHNNKNKGNSLEYDIDVKGTTWYSKEKHAHCNVAHTGDIFTKIGHFRSPDDTYREAWERKNRGLKKYELEKLSRWQYTKQELNYPKKIENRPENAKSHVSTWSLLDTSEGLSTKDKFCPQNGPPKKRSNIPLLTSAQTPSRSAFQPVIKDTYSLLGRRRINSDDFIGDQRTLGQTYAQHEDMLSQHYTHTFSRSLSRDASDTESFSDESEIDVVEISSNRKKATRHKVTLHNPPKLIKFNENGNDNMIEKPKKVSSNECHRQKDDKKTSFTDTDRSCKLPVCGATKPAKQSSSSDESMENKRKRGGGKIGRKRKRGYIYDPKPLVAKTKTTILPEEVKDNVYWDRRRRNNEAAKRSRENRRFKELEIMTEAKKLSAQNEALKLKIDRLEMRNQYLEELLSSKTIMGSTSSG